MSVLATDSNGQDALIITPGASQIVAFTTSTQSTALGAGTKIVRLVASQACYVEFGSNPTATSASMFLPAGVVEYFAVTPGDRIAALQVSSGGNLYVTEAA